MGTRTSSAGSRHWDAVYDAKGPEQVSWFQSEPATSLDLIDQLGIDWSLPVIDVGGGASTLVDRLLDRGHTDLTVLDISAHALRLAGQRLAGRGAQVEWIHADLLAWAPPRHYALWHDRAVFHFLTAAADRVRYRDLLTAGLAPGGYLILATFAADGPTHCSGLPVARHSVDDLAEHLGDSFSTVTSRRERHITPSGTVQPFTWLVARRDA